MARLKNTFSFTAPLESLHINFIHTAIFLPDEIIKALPKGRIRVKGTFNDTPFALAVMNRKEGGRFFIISGVLRKAAKLKVGDRVAVKFKLVDPDKVDMPEALEAVLAQDDEAMKVWNTFTPGLQRSLIHYVTSVKNIDSRINRALQLMNKAKAGLLETQKNKKKKQ